MMFVTPRDWQAMAQIEAAQMLGTPEGAAKLVEAKRYAVLADVVEQQHRDIERLSAAEPRRRARFDAALTVCRSAVRVIESSAYQGVSDEDCDLENSVRNWQAVERANRQQEQVNAAVRAHET